MDGRNNPVSPVDSRKPSKERGRKRQGLEASRRRQSTPTFSEGSGTNLDDAVVVRGPRTMEGVRDAEHIFLAERYGPKGWEWDIAGHAMSQRGDRTYDIVDLVFPPEVQFSVVFDLTHC